MHILGTSLIARTRKERIPCKVTMNRRLTNLGLVDGILGLPNVYQNLAELLNAGTDRQFCILGEKRMGTCGIKLRQRI